jgi:hypothetical protein
MVACGFAMAFQTLPGTDVSQLPIIPLVRGESFAGEHQRFAFLGDLKKMTITLVIFSGAIAHH